MRAIKERDVVRYLVKRVKALGGEVRRVQWIGRSNAPDLLVMIPRRNFTAYSVYVEVKAPGEKPTPAQLREHARMRKYKMLVWVVDSLQIIDELLA